MELRFFIASHKGFGDIKIRLIKVNKIVPDNEEQTMIMHLMSGTVRGNIKCNSVLNNSSNAKFFGLVH